MKRAIVTLGVLFSSYIAFGQVLPKGEHSFERLSWGQKLADVPALLSTRELIVVQLPQTGQLGSFASQFKCYQYEDSIFGRNAIIQLFFDSKSFCLASIALTPLFLKKEKMEEEMSLVWKVISEYYGEPFVAKTIPFVGTSMIWTRPPSEIRATKMKSLMNTIIISITPGKN